MGEMARWNLSISRELDIDVRTHLARRGGKKGDLSAFVEEAVARALRTDSLDAMVDDIWERNRNDDLTGEESEALVREEISKFRAENPMDRKTWTRTRCVSS